VLIFGTSKEAVPLSGVSSNKNDKKETKVMFVDMQVVEMNARKIAGESNFKDISVNWTVKIESLTSDRLRITAECLVAFEPPTFFELSATYALTYTHDGLTTQEVEKDIKALAGPCGAKNTLIMAELSQHMQGEPLIIPPYVQIDGR
jgi:hypothetical protein